MTLLDVRDEAGWTIEAPSATTIHMPAKEVLDHVASVAGDLSGPVAVLCNRGVTAQTVAPQLRMLGVDAMVVEGGMRGWIATLAAHVVDLGVAGLEVRQVQRPGRGCLSYVLAAGGHALVVDPAPDADFYIALALELDARIDTVVDTHLHADHLSGARALAHATGATLRLPAAALERGVTYADRVEPLHDGDLVELGDVEVRALALPGHTSDMTGLLVSGRALVAGDSLFADGIARPDLQQGDPEGTRAMARTLHATLHGRVLALGDDIVLLPGHTHPGVNSAAVAPRLAEVRAAVDLLAIDDPAEFARTLSSGMPPRPANYEAIIAVNAGLHAVRRRPRVRRQQLLMLRRTGIVMRPTAATSARYRVAHELCEPARRGLCRRLAERQAVGRARRRRGLRRRLAERQAVARAPLRARSSGEGQRGRELLVATVAELAVEAEVERRREAAADLRTTLDAGREQVVAVDLESDLAQLAQPAPDRLGGAGGAGERHRLDG